MKFPDPGGLLRSRIIYNWNPLKPPRMRRFYREFIFPGSLCFDIGAHVGDRTAVWRSLGARVVAVEPQSRCIRVLNRRFGRDRSVTLLRCALGNREETSLLRLSPGNPTLATLSAEWIEEMKQVRAFDGITWSGEETVTVTTLDMLIQRFGTPSFIKIDVEGFEAQVLKGLSAPIRALSFEYLPASISTARECLEILSAIGDYSYNVSVGERFVKEYPEWVGADEIRRYLSALAPGDNSGDVYARINGGTA